MSITVVVQVAKSLSDGLGHSHHGEGLWQFGERSVCKHVALLPDFLWLPREAIDMSLLLLPGFTAIGGEIQIPGCICCFCPSFPSPAMLWGLHFNSSTPNIFLGLQPQSVSGEPCLGHCFCSSPHSSSSMCFNMLTFICIDVRISQASKDVELRNLCWVIVVQLVVDVWGDSKVIFVSTMMVSRSFPLVFKKRKVYASISYGCVEQ